MTAVWTRVATQLRRRVLAALLLAAAIAVAGGLVVASAAGARRTATSLHRMRLAARMNDVSISPAVDPVALRRLPEVIDAGRLTYVFAAFPDLADEGAKIVPFAMGDAAMLRSVDAGQLVRGRRPEAGRPDEVLVSEGLARRRHLGPGARLRIRLATSADRDRVFRGGTPSATGPVVDAAVTGVLREPLDLAQDPSDQDVEYLGGQETVYLPVDFFRVHVAPLFGDDLLNEGGAAVRLRHGAADLPRFRADADRLAKAQFGADTILQTTPAAEAVGAATRAVRVQAVAMWVFTAAAAVAVLFLLGQALHRHVATDAADHVALHAMGMTRRQLRLASVGLAAVIAVGGAVGAVVVAVVASPATPFGLARQAEPHPGIAVNVAILSVGALAIVALFTAWVIPATRRIPTPDAVADGDRRRSRLARAVEGVGLPPPATSGIAMAFDAGGAAGVPVRSTMATVAVAIAAVTAAATFGSSLGALSSSPRTYGWTFDAAIGNPNNGFTAPAGTDAAAASEAMVQRIESDGDVGAFTGIAFADVEVGGTSVRAMGIDTSHGAALPSLISGRHPEGDDEVAMTNSALRRLHRKVGDTVALQSTSGRVGARVVGRIAAPPNVVSQTQSGRAVELPMATLARLQPDVTSTLFFVRYRDGVAPGTAYRGLRQTFGPVVLRAIRPAEVENLRRVAWMPWMLAVLLLVLGVGTLAHVLVASVRRRRRDLAILKTIGFSRTQVSATIAWQATTLAVFAVVVGIPVGIATGRAAWRMVATAADVVARPVAPAGPLALGAAAAVVVANAVAAGPAWIAGRTQASRLLRTE